MASKAHLKEDMEKLTDEMKECQVTELKLTTELDTVVNEVIDPALVAKWPKLDMKVPPLFIHQPVDFKEHAQKLLKMNMKFYRPYLGRYHTKIEFPSFADHKAMAQYCDKNKLPYHTFGHPSKRKIKVIIKGMPNDTNLSTVKEELKKVSIPVVRVHKMKNKENKVRPLLLLAVVPHDDEGKRIFAIKKILGSEVTLEPPKQKVKQCHRCQKWGHSQRYCHGTVKCVKCAGEHWSKKCTRDREQEPPKCANCGRGHTANFRDCSACPESLEHKDGCAYRQRNKAEYIGPPLPKLVTAKNVERNLYRNLGYIPNEEEKAVFKEYVVKAMEKERAQALAAAAAAAATAAADFFGEEYDGSEAAEDLEELYGYDMEPPDLYEGELYYNSDGDVCLD